MVLMLPERTNDLILEDNAREVGGYREVGCSDAFKPFTFLLHNRSNRYF